MTKQDVREIYKQKRLAISSKEKLKLDDLLLLQFQSFDFSTVQTVLSYWPMANMAEPNTHLFTGYLRHFVPNLQIAYPICNLKTLDMKAVLINEDTVYKTNQYGITEPQSTQTVAVENIDLVLVPNLIVDKKGFRVGYGKGFYDRFLANCNTDVTLMGFNYFDPIDRITDTNKFDIPLNFCITPTNVYEF